MANNNYPYLKVSGILKANDSSGVLSLADDIAYEYNDTNSDGLGSYEFIVTKTLKLKILELETLISGGGNSSEIGNQLQEIEALVNLAKEASLKAQTAQSLASGISSTIATNTKKVLDAKDEIEASISNINSKIENLNTIANDLKTVFETDGDMKIVSTEEYNLIEKTPNTFYICY